MSTRIESISAYLLGKPYMLGALGEGLHAFYDANPLYRMDAFDCETYVDTVLALAFAHDLTTFKDYIRKIRYKNGKISFINRNHFTSLDWNQNNQKQGFLQDITTRIHNKNGMPIAKIATAYIDKPNWYAHFSCDIIHLKHASQTHRKKRLALLQAQGRHLDSEISNIAYIPLSELFDKTGNANYTIFQQIPNASIVEIIRPNWDLTSSIGTHLNVSHLGIAIWKNGILMFRNASSAYNAVVDTPLIDYLRDAQKSPTIQGINIQIGLCNL